MIEKECRICFEKSNNNDLFINPCLCSGTSKWVHKECLNTWRIMNKNKEPYKICMECKYIYKFEYKYKKENFRIVYKKKRCTYFFFIFSSSIVLSCILSYIPINNNSIIIFCYNNSDCLYKSNILLNNSLLSLMFYESLSLMILSNIFNVFLIFTTLKNIKRKKKFLKLMWCKYVKNFVLVNHYFYTYYMFYKTSINVLLSFVTIFFIALQYFFNLILVIDTNNVIKKLNTKYNEKTLKSYKFFETIEDEKVCDSFELDNVELDEIILDSVSQKENEFENLI